MKGKCKLCSEERELFMDGMCDLCYDYLNKRVMRIARESLEEALGEQGK